MAVTNVTMTAGEGIMIAKPPYPHTWQLAGPKGMLVSINLDTGEYSFGDGYTPDEAARVFWEAVAGKRYYVTIDGYELRLTSVACPEQYDVYKDDKQVGYLRLRHGRFYASVPDCSENIVYETRECLGDGDFDESERMLFLSKAIDAIDRHYKGADKWP